MLGANMENLSLEKEVCLAHSFLFCAWISWVYKEPSFSMVLLIQLVSMVKILAASGLDEILVPDSEATGLGNLKT